MTTRSVGNYYEKKSVEYLKRMGYLCERTRSKVIFIKGRPISLHADMFGCIDIIGIKTSGVVFVQVKFLGENGTHVSAQARKDLAALPAPLGSVCLHIWRTGAKEPEIEIF